MCGIFGVFGPQQRKVEYVRQTYDGLRKLQHRGEESFGLATASSSSQVKTSTHRGKVREFKAEDLPFLNTMTRGVIGHNRYSTSGKSKKSAQSLVEEAQPLRSRNGTFAIAHNGNIPGLKGMHDTGCLMKFLEEHREKQWERRLIGLLKTVKVSYCLLVLTSTAMYAIRDRRGIRPLCLGYDKETNSWSVSSESCALRDDNFLRHIRPGEIVRIDDKGIHNVYLYPYRKLSFCALEYVYFMRPRSICDMGCTVGCVRRQLALQLAMAEDMIVVGATVVGIPSTGIDYGKQYASALQYSYMQCINKRTSQRTFIQPSTEARHLACEKKFVFEEPRIKGRRFIVVDDSIVRGNVMAFIVKKLRELGAKEVHVRIPSPRIVDICSLGIDIPTKTELIAYKKNNQHICATIGANSLRYLSLSRFESVVGAESYMECFGKALGD